MSDADLLAATTLKQLEKALAAGANIEAVDKKDDGKTKLHKLCKSKSGAMSKTEEAMALLLIEKGADVKRPDDGGVTPLHLAARSGTHAVIDALIAKGATCTLTNLGYTPLHYAISTHFKDAWVWDRLLEIGNPLDHVNKWGETPLSSAQASWNPTMVKYLLAKGANRDHKDGKGLTVLERATELKQDKIVALLK
jgi:ankyrin repeat protein